LKEIQYKIDIKPSYEWKEEAKQLGVSHGELEVFALSVEGYANKEIARILRIKYQSVKNHMHNFTKKISVKNNMQAVVVALSLNLISVKAKDMSLGGYINEFTIDNLVEYYRDHVSGKSWSAGIDDKKLRDLKVFLKEHGIEDEDWDIQKSQKELKERLEKERRSPPFFGQERRE
jgi:DNA-binding CsgD family transcriptional regulator